MMADAPSLSIVIASLDPGPVIFECLSALALQRSEDIEILVVDASADDTANRVRADFPWARVIEEKSARSLPRLRGIGIAEALAPVVGIIDAWCLVNSEWIAEANCIHHERPEPAAGGSVELAPSERASMSAWATYLFDYWEFVPPTPEGNTRVLAGNNIVYKRTALPRSTDLRRDGFWKAFANALLMSEGHGLWSSSKLSIQIRRRLPIGRFFRSRYHHGRSYAAMRVASSSWKTRIKWAVIAPGLPLLFMTRQIRGLAAKPTARKWFIVCSPLLFAFHLSWAFGELHGYLAGPGRSHDAIRS